MNPKPNPRNRDRARVRAVLIRELHRHFDPRLADYQRHVLRWVECAPEGAMFLPAPLMGWDGAPFTSKTPMGPQGRYQKNLREGRVARGLHPLGVGAGAA